MSLCATIASVAGGLGIFLLGMKQISDGLQVIAGAKMRRLVAAATTNRIFGVCTGAIVTGIIQASAVTTVMVVGLVTSGVMTLVQATNVIIGANIGTTVTAWLVSIFPKVGPEFGLAVTGVAALIYLFSKREGWKYTGLIFLGLGLIFYGLFLMNASLAPLAKSEAFVEFLSFFEANSAWGLIKCIMVGAVATALIQSSSATTAVSISLAINGVITFDTAASLVLGMNIGTTVTAWLASIGATTDARRAAMAHTLFNLIGVAIMAPFFLPVILPAIRSVWDIEAIVANDPTSLGIPIAAIHTAFNIVNTLVFLPFVKQFVALICRIIPDSAMREAPRLTILNPLKLAPVVAVEQARKEVEQMASQCREATHRLREMLLGEVDEPGIKLVMRVEEDLDTVQHEVSAFLGTILTRTMGSAVALRARMLLRVADEYESISDEGAMLCKLFARMRKNDLKLDDATRGELLKLHDACEQFASKVTDAFCMGKQFAPQVLAHAQSDEAAISAMIKEIRHAQMMRLGDKEHSLDPLSSVVVLDMINSYRRFKEDCANIGEAMLDEAR